MSTFSCAWVHMCVCVCVGVHACARLVQSSLSFHCSGLLAASAYASTPLSSLCFWDTQTSVWVFVRLHWCPAPLRLEPHEQKWRKSDEEQAANDSTKKKNRGKFSGGSGTDSFFKCGSFCCVTSVYNIQWQGRRDYSSLDQTTKENSNFLQAEKQKYLSWQEMTRKRVADKKYSSSGLQKVGSQKKQGMTQVLWWRSQSKHVFKF